MKKILYILMFLFPVVAFSQQFFYKSSPVDYKWMDVGNAGFSAGTSIETSLAFNPIDSLPYVAYQDSANSYRATVKKFNGTNWVYVGNAGFSVGEPIYINLVFNSSGQPYVAYSDYGLSYQANVLKFDGTNWVNVGNAGFTGGPAYWISLALSPSDGQPYVAYQDSMNSYKATVMRYSGANWVNFGSGNLSEGSAECTSLAFSPTNGHPFVAFCDGSTIPPWGVTVMEFVGGYWVHVGAKGFSSGEASFTNLAFDPSGEPFVAFINNYPGDGGFVMKYDGTNWINVGSNLFHTGTRTSLAFSPKNGQPYLAYSDGGDSGHATVMRFDGTDWINIGIEGFSAGAIDWTSLAFSPTGQPYVAYQDWANSYKITVMKYDSIYLGISEKKESRLFLYPNPATDNITMEISATKANSQLSIMNLIGKDVLIRQIVETKTTIDISNLPNGVYFVRLTNDKTVEVGKFVKQ